MKRLIREPQDYEIVQYIVENTEYLPDPFPIEQAKEWVGDEGVVLSHPTQNTDGPDDDRVDRERRRTFLHPS